VSAAAPAGFAPLLLLHLLLRLATLQRLLALRRRLFIPRHFVQLRRLLAHIGLHLRQQLALFIRQLLRIHALRHPQSVR
jgi:hypothetical protein